MQGMLLSDSAFRECVRPWVQSLALEKFWIEDILLVFYNKHSIHSPQDCTRTMILSLLAFPQSSGGSVPQHPLFDIIGINYWVCGNPIKDYISQNPL